MNDESEIPLVVCVPGADGTVERVRVGAARRCADGFVLHLEGLLLADAGVAPHVSLVAVEPRPASGLTPPPGFSSGTTPPPFASGATPPKGISIPGATVAGLELMADRARKTLADPKKKRWHKEVRDQLASIEAELARQRSRLAHEEGLVAAG